MLVKLLNNAAEAIENKKRLISVLDNYIANKLGRNRNNSEG
jgi:hypothetical protein